MPIDHETIIANAREPGSGNAVRPDSDFSGSSAASFLSNTRDNGVTSARYASTIDSIRNRRLSIKKLKEKGRGNKRMEKAKRKERKGRTAVEKIRQLRISIRVHCVSFCDRYRCTNGPKAVTHRTATRFLLCLKKKKKGREKLLPTGRDMNSRGLPFRDERRKLRQTT